MNYLTDKGILFTKEKKIFFHLYDNLRSDIDINHSEIIIYHKKY